MSLFYNTQKRISKFRPVIFVGFLDHLGIKNRRIVFIFGMGTAETILHNISSGFVKIRKVGSRRWPVSGGRCEVGSGRWTVDGLQQ